MIEIKDVPASWLAERILLRDDHRCVLCDEHAKGNLVFHEVVGGSINKDRWLSVSEVSPDDGHPTRFEVEDMLVTMCRACAHKVEHMTGSPYREILERDVWLQQYNTDHPMMSGFTKIGRRMSHLNRFGAEVTLKPENLAEHSYWVSVYSLAIAHDYVLKYNPDQIIDQSKLLLTSLFHDFPEIMVGDVPTPIKRRTKKIEAAYEKEESAAIDWLERNFELPFLKTLVNEFEHGDDIEYQISRAADKVSAIIYCVEEVSSGNRNLYIALRRFYDSLCKQIDTGHTDQWYLELLKDLKTWCDIAISKDLTRLPVDAEELKSLKERGV